MYKDPDRQRQSNRLSKRKAQGYKRSDRPMIFASISPDAIVSLSQLDQLIIEQYYREGKTLAAIASQLGLTRQAVGKRKKKLDQKLGIEPNSEKE